MKASKYQNPFLHVEAIAAAGVNGLFVAQPVTESDASGTQVPASPRRLALLAFSKEDRFGRGCFIAPVPGTGAGKKAA